MMTFARLLAGRSLLSRSVMAAGLILLGAAGLRLSMAADHFPFDQDLLLNAAPMGRVKRVPILNVAVDGRATIDLWCRTVHGRVQLSDRAMQIEPGPLPVGLPQYMVDGQCTPERMQADNDTLAALAQVTGWYRRGDTVTLTGSQTLRFRVSDH
jgi:heat shock protein HslJ